MADDRTALDNTIARRRMVDALVDAGDVTDPRVVTALRATPRHVLVPSVPDSHGHDVYSDTTLLIEPMYGPPRTSSTMPSLLALMIEASALTGAERILEIGTGTGYNTALLCHLLGDDAVFSVDVEVDLVDSARDRLASLGRYPTLVSGDGARGLPARSPFDRVLATCAAHRLPVAWLRQLRRGGRLVTPLRRGLAIVDRIDDDRWHGRFHRQAVYFMPLRAATDRGDEPMPLGAPSRRRPARCGALDTVHHRDVRFLLDLVLPDLTVGQHGPALTDLVVSTPDGSTAWLSGEDGAGTVDQCGPRSLWDEVEECVELFDELGRPGRERFGLTVDGDDQTVWFDEPTGLRWLL